VKSTHVTQKPKAFRTLMLDSALVAALAVGVITPTALQAQPSTAAAPMGGQAAPAGGMNHKDGMKDMMRGMGEKMSSMVMTGNHDVDFAQMMRIHHEGALDMAQMELKNGKDASMRKMARSIINAQRKEIVLIDRFLAKHGSRAKKS
jgi:uncharacterized protein (DUF305 family)